MPLMSYHHFSFTFHSFKYWMKIIEIRRYSVIFKGNCYFRNFTEAKPLPRKCNTCNYHNSLELLSSSHINFQVQSGSIIQAQNGIQFLQVWLC